MSAYLDICLTVAVHGVFASCILLSLPNSTISCDHTTDYWFINSSTWDVNWSKMRVKYKWHFGKKEQQKEKTARKMYEPPKCLASFSFGWSERESERTKGREKVWKESERTTTKPLKHSFDMTDSMISEIVFNFESIQLHFIFRIDNVCRAFDLLQIVPNLKFIVIIQSGFWATLTYYMTHYNLLCAAFIDSLVHSRLESISLNRGKMNRKKNRFRLEPRTIETSVLSTFFVLISAA